MTVVDNGKKRSPAHVVILLPSHGENLGYFTFDLANLVGYVSCRLIPAGLNLGILWQEGCYVDRNRNDLVEQAFANPDVSHVLFLDDDMRFPRDLLERLLAHHQPVVGVNYAKRTPPIVPVAIKRGIDPLATTPASTGLEQVMGLGFGAALIRRDVFTVLDYPWFEHYYHKGEKKWVGEDIDFCANLIELGIPVFVDQDLSKECEHVGRKGYKLADTPQWNDAALGPDIAPAPAPVLAVVP